MCCYIWAYYNKYIFLFSEKDCVKYVICFIICYNVILLGLVIFGWKYSFYDCHKKT